MAYYPKDTVRIHASALNINAATPLTVSEVAKVTIQVWYVGGATPTEMVIETNMTWDITLDDWYFDIFTDATWAVGGYQAMVIVYGNGASPQYLKQDYHSFRLNTKKVAGT